MKIPGYIRDAARWIDRQILAPRRQMRLAKAMGCDDALTKFRQAKRQHKPTRPYSKAIRKACHAKLQRELAR